jgi:hypothetical protein
VMFEDLSDHKTVIPAKAGIQRRSSHTSSPLS